MSFHSGMRLSIGQPWFDWQNGTPQSMQRAPCVHEVLDGRLGEDFEEVPGALLRIAVGDCLAGVLFESGRFAHRLDCCGVSQDAETQRTKDSVCSRCDRDDAVRSCVEFKSAFATVEYVALLL